MVLGGWLLGDKGDPREAEWFSLSLSPAQASWLFKGEESESSWASTTAELLSSLVALKTFDLKVEEPKGPSAHILCCGGGTDNKAATQLVRRRLSTKWPVMLVLMDYLDFCETKGLRCQLDWRPRDTNVEADQLTNEDFSSFDLEKRIKIKWEDIKLPMVELLMSYSETFSKRKFEATQMGAAQDHSKFAKSTWG